MFRPTQTRFRAAVVLCVLGATACLALAVGGVSPGSVEGQAREEDVAALVAYMLLALVFSFLCSVAEAVLLSITPSYIVGLREKHARLADLLKRLKIDNVDQSLAAILTLNTIANTVGAIGAGTKATAVFGSAWFGLFSAAMTLLILFLSEIIPKTIGAVYWRRLVRPIAQFVRFLIMILYPLIRVSEGLTRLIAHGKNVQVFSRDEFLAMADIGEKTGKIGEAEGHIIRNLFRFGKLKAKDIMTPRTVISALPAEMEVAEALEARPSSPFSRLPLYGKDLDDITGFVLRDDMLLTQARGRGEVKVDALKREIRNVTTEMPLPGLLEFFLDRRLHIAVVVGEYGDTRGLVTLEDVVETLLGMEIVDEMDTVEDMQALARKQWARRARTLGIETVEENPELDEKA